MDSVICRSQWREKETNILGPVFLLSRSLASRSVPGARSPGSLVPTLDSSVSLADGMAAHGVYVVLAVPNSLVLNNSFSMALGLKVPLLALVLCVLGFPRSVLLAVSSG